MPCPNCGGSIIGDGYMEVMHCEFVDESLLNDKEPDSKPIYCFSSLEEKIEEIELKKK